MNIGDTVSWTSQAAGTTKRKTGKIVAVVPAGKDPALYVPKGLLINAWRGDERDHESYLVRVGNKKLLYWPRVSQLKEKESKKK